MPIYFPGMTWTKPMIWFHVSPVFGFRVCILHAQGIGDFPTFINKNDPIVDKQIFHTYMERMAIPWNFAWHVLYSDVIYPCFRLIQFWPFIYIYISYSWLQWDFTYSNINRVFLVLLTGISGHICKCPTCRISFTSQVSVGDDTSKRSLGDVESIGHLPSPVYGLGMFGLSINSIFSTWWECLIETAIDKGFPIRTSIDRDCSIQTSIYRNVPINQHPFLEHILLKAPFTVDFPHVQIHCSLGSGDGTAIDHPWDLQWRSGQWLPATPLLVDD